MEDKLVIQQVISGLPTKVISQRGENYYLNLKIIPEDACGSTFRVFYQHKGTEELLAEKRFFVEEDDVKGKIEEVLIELSEKGFFVLAPIEVNRQKDRNKEVIYIEGEGVIE